MRAASRPSRDQEAEFEIIVPNDARLGGQELTILGSVSSDQEGKPGDGKTDKAETTIIIDAFDLTVDPSTAVIGQVIRVEGSGFSSDSSACIVSITVGDSPITKSTSNNGLGTADDPATTDDDEEDCGGDVVNADSNGNLADTFRMPLGAEGRPPAVDHQGQRKPRRHC